MSFAIHQTVIAAAPGDAVTRSALEIRRLLRCLGPSEIYARHVHRDLVDVVRPIDAFAVDSRREPPRAVIVHVSMGDPTWMEFVLGIESPLIVSYHNITPAHFFEPWDAALADLLRFGRLTLQVLAPRTAFALADSAYNADELTAAGYECPQVGGLLLDSSSLIEAQPDTAVLRGSVSRSGPKVLTVGQLFPHKRVDFALLAFRHLRYMRPDAHLVLAGASRLRPYRHAIETLIDDLGLGGSVTVTGEISTSELSAHYRTADLLLMVSEHEGFSVPLVEAMTFGVPIVARRFGAVPETLGDAGVLVDGDLSSAGIAIAADEVLTHGTARDVLVRGGVDRATQFSLDRQRTKFLELLSQAPL